ncbi:hypothetical protein F5884DRAFT_813954 [Xylogone sp. PMI_703]|nr:hypothetical protein F5884DRAFT_813954 [Xylogone sp. PMI_703]
MRMHHKYNLPDLIHANGSRRSKVLIACRHCRRRKVSELGPSLYYKRQKFFRSCIITTTSCQQQPGKACQNCERGKLQCIIERVQRAHTSRMSAHVEETNPENGNGYSARPPELMSPSGSRGQPPGVDSLLGVPVVGDASGLVRTSILTSGCEVMATSVSTEHRLQDLCVPLKETGRLIQTKWTSLGHDNTHMWNRGLDSSVPFVKDGIPPNPGKPTLQDFPQNGTPQAIRKYDLPQIAYQGSQMLFQELGVERSKISHFAACADHNYPDVIYPPSATTLSNSSAGSGRSHIPNNDSLPSLKVAFKDFIPK